MERQPGALARSTDDLVVGCGEGALADPRAAARGRQAARARRNFCAAIRLARRRALRMSALRLAPALRDAARDGGAGRRRRAAWPPVRAAAPKKASRPRARALLDLTHGTLRRYGRVQAIVRQLSRRGSPIRWSRRCCGARCMRCESGRYAEYTVVDQAVRACALLERWSAKGYVNALLRALPARARRARSAHAAPTTRRATSIRAGGSTCVRGAYPETLGGRFWRPATRIRRWRCA